MEMLSYHNDVAIKEKYLMRVRAHALADEIVQGVYWQEGKGCAVGCTIHGDDHSRYEEELGIPQWLARLEDRIFEGLPNEQAKLWPEQFLEAIPVGKDLNPIKWKFCAFILKENVERVLSLDISDELKKQVVDAVRGCLALHEQALLTGSFDESAARSAESAAWSAAWSAARAAARSAAWSAASAAAESAESAAAWSAESAARSAAWSAARAAESAESAAESAARAAESAESAAESAAYERYRDELLRLLREA